MPKVPHPSPNAARAVEVLAFPDVQLLDVTGPLQAFASANAHVTKAGQPPPYSISVVAKAGGTVPASAGVALSVHSLPALSWPVDTLIVAGGVGVDAAAEDTEVVSWLRERAANARRTASVCTGAFLLAASGALEGRRAVTHWAYCAELARRFPRVCVESDPIFVRDGSIWTSAGVTAGIDLALALIEEDLGREIALAVARYLVVFLKRPGGQAQFSAALSLQTGEERFGPLHAWIGDNLSRDLSLSVLAAQARMSERSFSRHYVEATGMTPARAVERMRVEAARLQLSETKAPIKRIAQRCGFGAEETMRRSFIRLLSISPQDYRARFGG